MSHGDKGRRPQNRAPLFFFLQVLSGIPYLCTLAVYCCYVALTSTLDVHHAAQCLQLAFRSNSRGPAARTLFRVVHDGVRAAVLFGATVLHGDCSNPCGHAFRSNSSAVAIVVFSKSVNHFVIGYNIRVVAESHDGVGKAGPGRADAGTRSLKAGVE